MKNDYKPIKPMKEVPDQLRKLRRQFLRYQQAEACHTRNCLNLPAMPVQSTALIVPCLLTGIFLMPTWNAFMSLPEKSLLRRLRTSEWNCLDVLRSN